MKLLLKIIFILFIVVAFFLLLYEAKHSEKVLILAQYEMLACEDCNHMSVIQSSDKRLIKKTIIPVAEKNKIEEVVGSAIGNDRRLVCMEGRLYFIKIYFNIVDPSGIRFYVDELKDINFCERINQ